MPEQKFINTQVDASGASSVKITTEYHIPIDSNDYKSFKAQVVDCIAAI
jgi:hypothetical protein